ncbi:MAG: sulfatase-like hydrolase/transferase [Candidatus Hydrogenedentes bacterium]|nr:sulfatase-like hydrolase/transferase [Candidatus Hydrogenedentota bacterium]
MFRLRYTPLFLLAVLAAPPSPAEAPPNILILFADDLGYGDIGCYGSAIKTPNVDRLAAEGMRFTDFYAGHPNCSASRAALLTGRIAPRTGVYSYIPPDHGMHLPPDEITLARLLKNAGYATGLFGKWHLSALDGPSQPAPAAYGFDYTFCTRNNAEPSHRNPDNFYRNGEPLGVLEGYSCDLVAAEAIRWLEGRAPDAPPFLAYVAFHEPHQKIASPPDLVAEYRAAGHEHPEYAANIANLDRAIGRILDTLDHFGAAANTVVVFASDNGPWREGSQGPLRGKKSDVWEGGIRVPGVFRWPGHIPAGATSGEPAGVVDLLPTLCAITGVEPPADRRIDGTSLLPAFQGQPLQRQTPLFWFFYRTSPQIALRDGDWGIVGFIDDPVPQRTHWLAAEDMPFIKTAVPARFELYNLRQDIGQRHDLASSEPDRLEAMRRALLGLHREVVEEGDDWTEAIRGYTRP